MILDEVKERIAEIKSDVNETNNDYAHEEEDNLYEDFIRHVAEVGDVTLKELATEILKTKDINFERWYR